MKRSSSELWMALFTIFVVTLAYGLVAVLTQGIPSASGLFGHAIGILGFILMLVTEILYSLRKRARTGRWGRMAIWLKFHIYTGLVGPYLVLLHTSWQFNGLAGALTLLTVIIVFSGLVGRYIYTAVPRTLDGAVVEADELARQGQAAEDKLQEGLQASPEIAGLLSELIAAPAGPAGSNPALILERSYLDWQYRRKWRQVRRGLPSAAREQAALLESLQMRRRELLRQLQSLAAARRLLSLWHAIHLPIGVVLFSTAFIHVAAVLYFAAGLR